VKSPNPAFRQVDVPLASTFMLSTKPGKEAWVQIGTRQPTHASQIGRRCIILSVRSPAAVRVQRRNLSLKLGAKAEPARELAYRLYTLCERKKRAPEALAYNGLVQSWPELAGRFQFD
jgi:adenine-specific DNA methylase